MVGSNGDRVCSKGDSKAAGIAIDNAKVLLALGGRQPSQSHVLQVGVTMQGATAAKQA